MISLGVIVSGVFQGGSAKRPFAEENHSTETLVLDRSDESFGVGVQVGRARRQTDDLDAGVIQEISERRSELGIPVRIVAREWNIRQLSHLVRIGYSSQDSVRLSSWTVRYP